MTDQHVLDPSAVTLEAGRPTTTSVVVAQVFGKQHKDVLRAIRGLDCPAEFTERNFALSEFTDPTGRKLPMYRMTRDGFTFLCMGFTGKEAARWKIAYLEAFNRMEAELQRQHAEQYNAEVGAEFTGRVVELDFGKGVVAAEWDTAGNLWLSDQELDALLGYRLRNSTLNLYHRYEREFPVGSVWLYRDERGAQRALFTPLAWEVIARRSTVPLAAALGLAAVQYYVPPQMMEVERERYMRLARTARESGEHFQRIAAASNELASAVAAAAEPVYLAAMSVEECHPMLPRANKTH
ncbi:TPA: Rha family transcriptional regulator [Pseudomonas aeruginosa]|nr:Rha family transcriptional regulator [Pseudomonas aeruginosa]